MTHANLPALSVGSVQIRQHNGLYSLNDLHRASGGDSKHKPHRFIRLDTTQALITELSKSPDMGLFQPAEISNSSDVRNYQPAEMVKGANLHLFLQTTRGRYASTYACRELVIAYAAWISAEFHLKVIRVFLEAVDRAQQVLPPAQPASPAALPAPDVLIPDDVQAAIDTKAWELSAQAHRIVHRRLRFLTESTACGYPQRTVNSEEALAHIAATTLDDAFVPLQPDLYSMQLMAKAIADSAQRYADAVNKGITALRQRDVLLAPVLNAA